MKRSLCLVFLGATAPAAAASVPDLKVSLHRTSMATAAHVTASADVWTMTCGDSAWCEGGSPELVLEQGVASAAAFARAVAGEVNSTANAQASIGFNLEGQSISNVAGIAQQTVVGRDSWEEGDYLGGGTTTHLAASATHVVSMGGVPGITSGFGDLPVAWMSAGTHGGEAWFMMDYSLSGSWMMQLGAASMSLSIDQGGTNVFAANGGMMWVPNDIDGGQVNASLQTTVTGGSPGLLSGYQEECLGATLCGAPYEVNTMQAGSQAVLIAALKVTSPKDDVGQPTRYWANGFEIDGPYQ